MFLKNKYTIWYHQIIANAQSRINNGYVEKHHIIPKCLGGTDDASNLVRLTAREHYICHLLLTKMTEGLIRRKMLFAHWRMVHGNQNQSRYQLTNRQYESAKIAMGRAISEQNRNQILSKTRNKGKVPWNKGKTGVMSQEARMKISAARLGKGHTAETRKRLSDSAKTQNNTVGAKSKYRWVLRNKISGKLAETINLRKWCSENDTNSAYIYTGRSDWEILEKYHYRTGIRIS
jgi:hypothetical protein